MLPPQPHRLLTDYCFGGGGAPPAAGAVIGAAPGGGPARIVFVGHAFFQKCRARRTEQLLIVGAEFAGLHFLSLA